MFKRIAIIFFFILVLTLPASAEEIKAPSAKTGEIHGNQLMLGVTDDANKDLMMFRTTPEGYPKVSLATALTSTADSVACLGNVAHDTVDTGNPVKIGMKAITLKTSIGPVASGDRVDWMATRQGIPFVLPGHPNMIRAGSGRITIARTNIPLLSATATQRILITGITVSVSAAVSVSPSILIGLYVDTGTTPAFGAGVVFDHPAMPAGSAITIGGTGGILAIGELGEDLLITSDVPTGGSITVVVSYNLLTDN